MKVVRCYRCSKAFATSGLLQTAAQCSGVVILWSVELLSQLGLESNNATNSREPGSGQE